MKTEFKFSYPSSEKVYLSGRLYPEIKVGMRKVHLTPTVTIKKGERCEKNNAPVYIYMIPVELIVILILIST